MTRPTTTSSSDSILSKKQQRQHGDRHGAEPGGRPRGCGGGLNARGDVVFGGGLP